MDDKSTSICDNLDEGSLDYVLSACACHIGLEKAKKKLKRIEAVDNARTKIEDLLDSAVLTWNEDRLARKKVYMDEIIVMPFCRGTYSSGNLPTRSSRCEHETGNIRELEWMASDPYTDDEGYGYWKNQLYHDGRKCKKWRQLCKRNDKEAEVLVDRDFNKFPSTPARLHPFFRTGEPWSEHMNMKSVTRLHTDNLQTYFVTRKQITDMLVDYEKEAVEFTFNCCSNSINCEGSECNDFVQDCVINNTQISGGGKESDSGVTEENIFIPMTNNNYIVYGAGGIMLIILIILLIVALSN